MRLPRSYLILSIVLLFVNVVVYTTGLGGPELLKWTSTLLPIITAIMGIVGVSMAVGELKTWDKTKVAWLLLAVGMALSALGETSYCLLDTVMGINVEELGSTVADIFWMAAYIPYMLSLLILMDGYRKSGLPMGNIMKYGVAIVVGVMAAVSIAIWILVPILQDTETELLDKIVYMYYPIGDFILLIPAALLILVTMQFGKGIVSLPWKCIALAFLLWAVADIVYSYLGWNELYGDGNLIDALWNISYLLIGAAGLYEKSVIRSA